MKTVSITIEAPLLADLDRQIKAHSDLGRSEVIRQAIREWLDRRKLKKKIQKEIEGYQKKPVQPDEFDALLARQEFPK